jgi:hypothetical protein
MRGWPAVYDKLVLGLACAPLGLAFALYGLAGLDTFDRRWIAILAALLALGTLIRIAWTFRRLARITALPDGSSAATHGVTLRRRGLVMVAVWSLGGLVSLLLSDPHIAFATVGIVAFTMGVEELGQAAIIARWERRHEAFVLVVNEQLYAGGRP